MAADDFKKLLDEQKKSNELLSSISTGQQEQGTAKEIVKQALPEIANERALFKKREKFEKKEGKTEVDDKIEKQTKTIVKGQEEEKLSSDKVAKFLQNSNSKLKELYNLQFAFGLGREKMDEATRKFNNAFYGRSRKKDVEEKKKIDLETERLELQKTEIERRGGDAEKDAKYKTDMLALERRRDRLARRNASGILSRGFQGLKNQAKIIASLLTIGSVMRGVLGGIKGLAKGLFAGAGKIVGAGIGGLKKFALLAFLPVVLAFLNSDMWEKTKIFLSDKLIPAIKFLYENVFIPLKNFFSDVFLGTFENIKILLFGEGGSFDNPKEGSLGSALKKFQEGDIFGGLKDIVLSLTTFLKNSVNTTFEALKKNILEPVFGIDLGDKTIYGVITGFFQSVFDKVKSIFTDLGAKVSYAFSLQNGLLADLWDTAFPLLKGKNPFRKKELELKSDLMNREEVGGLDQRTITIIKKFRTSGLRGNQTIEEKGAVLSGSIVTENEDGTLEVQTPANIQSQVNERLRMSDLMNREEVRGIETNAISLSSIKSNIKKIREKNLKNINKVVGSSLYDVAELEKEIQLIAKNLEIKGFYGRGFNPNRIERMFQDENDMGGNPGPIMPQLFNSGNNIFNGGDSFAIMGKDLGSPHPLINENAP